MPENCEPIDIYQHFRSLGDELRALRNRVRTYIRDRHYLTDGEWKETIVRQVLKRHLPPKLAVVSGFVVTRDCVSSQIDILVYDTDFPVLFRDGDLAFVTPDSVRAIVEVKTNVNRGEFEQAIEKLAKNCTMIRKHRGGKVLAGLFSFDSGLHDTEALISLQRICNREYGRIVELACLGESHLVHYWYYEPPDGRRPYGKWHLYELPDVAFGYFLHNLIHHLVGQSVDENLNTWFPSVDKELHKIGEMPRDGGVGNHEG